MSVRAYWDIWCDRLHCNVWMHTEGRNAHTARREARSAGWRRIGTSDVCPDCVKGDAP